MNILFLSGWYPDPPNNGSKLRIFNLVRGLADEHDVTLMALADRKGARATGELSRICTGVITTPRRPYNSRSIRALLGFLAPTPRVIVDTYQSSMEKQIKEFLANNKCDLVIASQWITAMYWPAFKFHPAIFEEVEVGMFEAKMLNSAGWAGRLRHQLSILKLGYYLRGILPRYRACTVASHVEADRLHRIVPRYDAVEIIPNLLDQAVYAGIRLTPTPNTLVFTGSLHYFANHDAMLWFLSSIYGLIQADAPDLRLIITGNHANRPLPHSENVEFTGYVDDVRPVLASASVSLAPIRLGGGTRLKILEAMALGVPVVSTSLGAEGLGAKHEEHLLIGDTPAEFAHGVIRILNDLPLRKRLIDNASQLVRDRYDAKVVIPQFLQLVERAAAS